MNVFFLSPVAPYLSIGKGSAYYSKGERQEMKKQFTQSIHDQLQIRFQVQFMLLTLFN
jgi:hypothetical protein